MLKKRLPPKRPTAEINVVPYIDVMLVLLVIFMITAPMLTQGVTVTLPKASSEVIENKDREPIIVSVDQNGQYFLNIHEQPNVAIDPQAMMVRVAAELELARQEQQKLSVLVKGDQGVAYGSVVHLMGLLKQAGAAEVGLLTDSSAPSEESP